MPVIDINELALSTEPPALNPEPGPRDDSGEMESWLSGPPIVLVVDDDEDARETIATMLEGHHVSVIKVSTGEAALYTAAAFPVAAIVLDVMLPDWTGFDICRILRDDPTTKDIPIIMLTALTRVVDEVSGVLAGASAYLVKPVSREKLLQHLRDLI